MEHNCSTCYHNITNNCEKPSQACGYWYSPAADIQGYKYAARTKDAESSKFIHLRRLKEKDDKIMAAYKKEHNYT